MTKEYCLPIRVYVEDTDAGGIVYYANYLKYIERARTELIRTLGYDKPALFGDLQFVVHSVEIKYRQPAVLDDEVVATAKLIKVSRTSFTIAQKVLRNDEVLVEAVVKVACISHEKKRPTAIPADMLKTLQAAV
ncbi:MAG: tol-pal system-associated acyl-CoA thioesterase [Porticoccus sp.]